MHQKRIIIIHGWAGYPQEGWFPWLERQLQRRGAKAVVPALPNAAHPKMAEWLAAITQAVGQPDANTYLVGHSLGCIAILRYLEQLPAGQKIGGAVLVAGFSEPLGILEINNFFQTPLNYNKVKSHGSRFIAINSNNDPFVPLEKGEVLRDSLDAELIVVQNAGHLNKEAGFVKLPLVLEKVCALADLPLRKWF